MFINQRKYMICYRIDTTSDPRCPHLDNRTNLRLALFDTTGLKKTVPRSDIHQRSNSNILQWLLSRPSRARELKLIYPYIAICGGNSRAPRGRVS
jgi:hypothetical protein